MALKPLNSAAGFSVGETPSTVISGNGDISANNFSTTGVANLNAIGNVRISGGTNGQIIQTDGAGNLSFATLSPTSLTNGNSNVQVLANANITFSSTGNANIVVITGTGANVNGYLTVNGNAQFNNANLGNLATANYINVSSNLTVTNLESNTNVNFTSAGNVSLGAVGNVKITGGTGGYVLTTDGSGNLSWSATGSPTIIQNGNSNVSVPIANGNVLINASGTGEWKFDTTGNLTGPAAGSANLGNAVYANFFIGSGNNLSNIQGANVSGDVANANYANFAGTAYSVSGANVSGEVANANYATFAGTAYSVSGANVSGEVANANYATYANSANFAGTAYSVDGANVSGQVANALVAGTVYTNAQPNITSVGTLSSLDVTGNVSAGNITMSGGNITGVNNISANSANYAANVILNNLTVNLALAGNTANFSGNVITNNLTVNLELAGNTANFIGNITSLNANLGNLATANYVNVANDLTVLGNITGANIIGPLANGTSNVKVYSNANVEITINGSANVASFTSTGLYVDGEINTTAGNILSNGNVSANGFLNSANANVTGQANVGSLLTSNITATTGVITISAAGSNQNVVLAPSGTGNVDVGLHNIVQVGAPVNPNDAATKEYVDANSQGLFIHPAANVLTSSNLTASYLNGGTSLTVDSITGNKTITFTGNHGLIVDDNIIFTNSFNGIIGGEGYFVDSAPTLTSITVRDGYFGAEVTTLTNGTTLAEPALGNGGVGATLTNSGANAALTIDSVLMTVGKRVLVIGQTNQFENGIYEVTTVGTGSVPWVLTRASDGNSYHPKSTTALCNGSYFFISQGTTYFGSSYVLTTPDGEIDIGITNIGFSLFSIAGSYTAGNGISISGSIISANTDGVTTDISGGNIVIKTSANLTTPNIGDATFSSLSWNSLSNGNVTANNLSIGNIANITGNLRVDGIIQSNGNVTSNAYINGNNASFTNFANIGGNLLADYITSNHTVFTSNANVSSTTITNNLTVNLELAGNTANFTGNINSALNANLGNLVTANYVNVANQVNGNIASFTGNITGANVIANSYVFAPAIVQNASTYDTRISLSSAAGIIEANIGGNATQFLPGGQIRLSGAATIYGGTLDGSQIVLGTTQTDLVQNRGGNVTVQVGTGGSTANTWTFANNGNTIFPAAATVSLGNLATANTVTVNNNLNVGPLTQIAYGNVTTAAITANQTIASLSATGVSGVEFLVKGIDSAGSKYSIATVQAVTDGANVEYSVFGTVQLGGFTGSLAVNIAGSNVALQVTPASSNSTVWVTQVRTI
jgi:hypothetical protein